MLGAVLPDISAMQVLESIFAGSNAMQQVSPSLPERRISGLRCPASNRRLGITAQAIAHRRERELAVALLSKDADRGKRTQQPVEGVRIALRQRRQLTGGARPILQVVSDTKS